MDGKYVVFVKFFKKLDSGIWGACGGGNSKVIFPEVGQQGVHRTGEGKQGYENSAEDNQKAIKYSQMLLCSDENPALIINYKQLLTFVKFVIVQIEQNSWNIVEIARYDML